MLKLVDAIVIGNLVYENPNCLLKIFDRFQGIEERDSGYFPGSFLFRLGFNHMFLPGGTNGSTEAYYFQDQFLKGRQTGRYVLV